MVNSFVVQQLDHQARPLIRMDGNCAIGFSNVANGGLGAGWKVVDGEAYGSEGTPGAWVSISVNGAVDGRDRGGGGMRKREIVHGPVFARLARFWDPGERRGLERANKCLDLQTSTWADVTALLELVGDHLSVSFRVLV